MSFMIKRKLAFTTFLLGLFVTAQAGQEAFVMHINGKPVTTSEFLYNYRKNNAENVIDKKTVTDYAQLFINYKLKVEAALDAHLDTLASFQREFRTYRDQQIRPMLVPKMAIENECRAYYDRMLSSLQGKELIQPAHIFLRVPQRCPADQTAQIKVRIDSIYQALQGGASFEELARSLSQDTQSAMRGGTLPWIGPSQTLKEFEDVAYSLEVGEYSEPFLSTVGYHIVLLKGKKNLEPYEELKDNIYKFLESQGLETRLSTAVLDSISRYSDSNKSVEEILDEETRRLCDEDSDLKYLIQEYHDGLLLFEECTREVWEPASKDTSALEKYFKAHSKQYGWEEPHFRGMVYYCIHESDLKKVKKALKKVSEDKWIATVREQFNKDSVTVRMDYGLFAKGRNGTVDVLGLKDKHAEIKPVKGFPYASVIGKRLKKGPSSWTDVSKQVVSDYQRYREQQFVEELRKRYPVEIHEDVLKALDEK